MKHIKITCIGRKDEIQQYYGVKFDNGEISYIDEKGKVHTTKHVDTLLIKYDLAGIVIDIIP